VLVLQDIGNNYVRCKPANWSSYWNNATGHVSGNRLSWPRLCQFV